MDPVTIVILVVVVAILGVGGGVFLRLRRKPKEEPVYHFNCPSCRRRLRYRAAQIGHSGQCPMCKRNLTFPAAPGLGEKKSPRAR